MKELNLKPIIMECQMDELSNDEQFILSKAIEMTNNSYAKYSHFHVGAALLLETGEVIPGCNQENAAFPSGLCAERTAIFAAQAQCPEHAIIALAIAARNNGGLLQEPVTPCGACRQVILEIEDRYQKPVRILLYGKDGVYVVSSVKDLLPLSFVDASMK